jgi:hypothetical protein
MLTFRSALPNEKGDWVSDVQTNPGKVYAVRGIVANKSEIAFDIKCIKPIEAIRADFTVRFRLF